MSRGYCPNCSEFFENGKICGRCGEKLVIYPDNIEEPYEYNNDESRDSGLIDVYSNNKISKPKIIGLAALLLYNIIGIIISLNIADKMIKSNQKFLVKIEVSYFWLWLFFAINIVLILGAVFLRKNKSVLCVVGQGILWLITLMLSFGIKELNYDDMAVSWENGVVTSFGMGTEVSRALCVASFSIGHLFVIALWIAAVVLVAIGSYQNSVGENNR